MESTLGREAILERELELAKDGSLEALLSNSRLRAGATGKAETFSGADFRFEATDGMTEAGGLRASVLSVNWKWAVAMFYT